jgi:alkanesulfonate monooxygenase SsuD/methylene tetrahydromethanopterin reductase-like flavin-dependent oxidoreductase (luciferase family)
MRFHMNILATYFPDRDPPYDVYYQQILEQIQLAKELGWECFMFNEHHFLGYGGLIAHPAVMLAAAAARTSKIRLGTCISIITLKHPLQLAEEYAMVDVISGGRLEFGIGSGNTGLDYRVFGISREESRARMDEANEVIIKAWSKERFSHAGKFWKFEEITLYPRPVQRPHPPIWVAGTSAETLGWAGRKGYDIMTVGHPHPPDTVRAGIEAWREGLKMSGFDPEKKRCQFHIRTFVDENAKRAHEVATKAITRYDAISRIGRREDAKPKSTDWEGMLASGRNLYGNPEQCIQIIHNSMKHYSFNVLTNTFNFGGIPHDMIKKSMRLFAKEVMPAFR